jgi:hypothetical protein
MERTQIQLTRAQLNALRVLAGQQNRSLAELIRESVDVFVTRATAAGDRQARLERAKSAAGRYASGSGDGSTRHDDHLAAALG